MALSPEMRRLKSRWSAGNAWPKRLEWLEVGGLRGWTGQRISFSFPIVAISGENGSGKSTLLQAAASVYRGATANDTWFPSEFFPRTTWDAVNDIIIRYGYQQGDEHLSGSIRKPTSRWLGHSERPERLVVYSDLNRLQPVGTRVGYARIAKTTHTEASADAFTAGEVQRFSTVMGRSYDEARIALTDIDRRRQVAVLSRSGTSYSGFHQGSGETTVAELIRTALPRYSLVLIDEIEASLHPRAQRKLIRDLADRCRESDLQVILTTHSPYILEELPLEARMHVLESGGAKVIAPGASPQFAMTKMDDEAHPECDVYVEDEAAKVFVSEILSARSRDSFTRSSIVPFGGAGVGRALGLMVAQDRFSRPTCVFLDGDVGANPGCNLLPGADPPERVVFEALQPLQFGDVWSRIGRDLAAVDDACSRAMTGNDHHGWVNAAANELRCGGITLWHAMCAEWVARCLTAESADQVVGPIETALAAMDGRA